MARTELDDHLRTTALKAGAIGVEDARAVDVRWDGARVAAVVFERRGEGGRAGAQRFEIACRRLVVADGVRSPLGKVLGREWHRDTVYGVAGRSYVASTMTDDPWISSHLELRDEKGAVLSGYGWIFPLGTGDVNLGVGTLATAKRPADIAIKPLMQFYADQRREEFGLSGELRMPTSALLPMGGAVSNVAGANWALIGDAAGCVNPLNGEGIDYAYETGRLAAGLIAEAAARGEDAVLARYPDLLDEEYGLYFKVARLFAKVIGNPTLIRELTRVGMRSQPLMEWALRVMANLLRDEDRGAAEAAYSAIAGMVRLVPDRLIAS